MPVTGNITSLAPISDGEARRLAAAAVTLDIDAVVPGRLLLSAYLYHFPTGRFQISAVLVDTGSEVCLCAPEFFGDAQPCPAVTIAGVNSDSIVRQSGKALVLLGEGVSRRAVGIKAHSTGIISHGLVKLLLSATVAKALGLVSGDLHSSLTPAARLPELATAADLVHVAAMSTTKAKRRTTTTTDATAARRERGQTSHNSSATASWTHTSFDAPWGTYTGIADSRSEYYDPGDAEGSEDEHVRIAYACRAEVLELSPIRQAFVNLADIQVGKSMDRQGGNPFIGKPSTLDDISYGVCCTEEEAAASGIPNLHCGGALTIAQVQRLRTLFTKYSGVFGTKRVPEPVRHPPVDVQIKADEPGPNGVKHSRPVHLPAPTMGPNTHKYFWLSRQAKEKEGLIFRNPLSRWATYSHLTGKPPYDKDGVPGKLREVDDRRPINRKTVPMRYVPGDGREQLERASVPSPFRLSTDALAAFNGFTLTPRSSEIMTTWMPKGPNVSDGYEKMSPTRLGFGWCNAPAIQGTFYDEVKNGMAQRTQERLASWVDDFMLSAPPLENRIVAFNEFEEDTEDFLSILDINNVQLTAPKTFVGHRDNDFYGFSISEMGGSALSDRNIAVIEALPHPRNVHELQTVLGFLGFMRNYCKEYSDKAAPLFALTKKGRKWEWQEEHKAAFESLRHHLVHSTRNYRPDYDHQLVLETDASDTAIGGRLYQQYGGEDHNIGFWSRTLSGAERKLSVPMRECIALVEGIAWSRIYALSSPMTLLCLTDHHALQFMANVDRGSLSSTQFASVADVRFEVRWIPGRRNRAADFLSRLTTTGPQELARPGLLEAVKQVLQRLGEQHRDSREVWVWAQRDTDEVARVVQEWRRPTNPITKGSTTGNKLLKGSWTFALLAPSPLTAAADTAALLMSGQPGAVLLPADLLLSVVDNGRGDPEPGLVRRLKAASVLSFPLVNQVWVVQGATFDNAVCLSAEAYTVTAATTWLHTYNTRSRRPTGVTETATTTGTTTLPTAKTATTVATSMTAPATTATTATESTTATTMAPPAAIATEGVDYDPALELELASKRDVVRARLARMLVWELQLELQRRRASTKGKRADLLARLTTMVLAEQPGSADVEEDNSDEDDVEEGARSTTRLGPRRVIDVALEQLGPTTTWPEEQSEDDCPRAFRMVRQSDGMLMYAKPGEVPRAVVPEAHRRKIIELCHLEMGHHTASTKGHVKQLFYWPTLSADCIEYTKNCVGCITSKRRVQHLHGLYRNLDFFGVGMHLAMDIKRWGVGDTGRYLLGVVDRFSGYLHLIIIKDKTAESVINGLLTNVVLKYGQPATIACDGEKAFVSQGLREWCARRGTRILPPLPYSATGHSAAEVPWTRVVPAFRRKSQFPGDETDVAEIAWSYNIAAKGSTGFAPYTIQHGHPPATHSERVAEARRVLGADVEAPAATEELLVAAAAVREMAAARGNYNRRITARKLNEASPYTLEPIPVGQCVYYYAPPSGTKKTTAGDRNADYVKLYKGPATVVVRLSNVGYVVRHDKTNALAYRHRQHLRPVDRDYVTKGQDSAAAFE